MILDHGLSVRSFRPLWAIEELSLAADLRMLPFPPRMLQREFLAIKPPGAVPLRIDGGTHMTESAAIRQYLAARHAPGQLDVGVSEADHGAYLNFLHFGEATLSFPQTPVRRWAAAPDERP